MNNQWKEDYYTILEVDRHASLEEIKKAYREKISQYHPDKFKKQSLTERRRAESMARLANEAYEVLSNKKGEKDDYDAWWDMMTLEKQLEEARKKAVAQEAAKRAVTEAEEQRKAAERQATEATKKSSLALAKTAKGDITSYDKDFAKFQLNRTEKGGETKKPINIKKVITIVVAGVALVGVVTAAYFLGKGKDQPENTTPKEDQDAEKNTEETTSIIFDNWSQMTDSYDKATIEEVRKAINGEESSMSQDQADEILNDMVNQAVVPNINKVINGTDEEVNEINLSSLIQDGTEGKEAVVDMESYLNGMITDEANGQNYARRAFEDQARILGEDETVGGLNVTTDSEVSPSVRYIWARLAIGANTIADVREYGITVEINGNTYTQDEIGDPSRLEEIAGQALKDLGSSEKRINLN